MVLIWKSFPLFQVTLNSKVVLRGPQLLFMLRHFPKLVDVSLASNLGADIIDDSTTHRLFSLLPGSFPFLRRLTLGGWVFSLDNCEKVGSIFCYPKVIRVFSVFKGLVKRYFRFLFTAKER